MKRKWLLIPALLLVVAGMVMISCPSDPDPIERSDPVEATWIVEDGRVTIPLTLNSAFTDNTKYELILDVTAVDDPLLGCHFQGQLFYVSGEHEFLLADSQDAFPNVIAKEPRKYRWTFTAGTFGADAQTEATAGGYELWDKTAITVTAPAKLEFRIRTRTPDWKDFGKDGEKYNFLPNVASGSNAQEQTEEVDYGKTGIKAGIETGATGTDGVTFRVKPVISYTADEAITGKGGSDNAANGKGNIQEEEFEKLKEVETAHPGSILRFECQVKVGAKGSENLEPGWGFGGVGNNMKKVRKQNPVLALLIPNDTVPTGNLMPITIDLLIEDILLASATDPFWTLVNLNSTDASQIVVNSMKIYTAP